MNINNIEDMIEGVEYIQFNDLLTYKKDKGELYYQPYYNSDEWHLIADPCYNTINTTYGEKTTEGDENVSTSLKEELNKLTNSDEETQYLEVVERLKDIAISGEYIAHIDKDELSFNNAQRLREEYLEVELLDDNGEYIVREYWKIGW